MLCIRLMLIQPGARLSDLMSYVQLTKMTEYVGFPTFPLSISNAQVKQLATTLQMKTDDKDWNLDRFAQTLQGKQQP